VAEGAAGPTFTGSASYHGSRLPHLSLLLYAALWFSLDVVCCGSFPMRARMRWTTEVITVDPDTLVQAVAKLPSEKRISGFPLSMPPIG
jgi:hypothetical protein